MANQSETKKIFAEIMNREEEINLAETALLFAKEVEYPGLDISKYIRKIDSTADEIKWRVRNNTDPRFLIGEINKSLFAEGGFRGNEDNYYDPRNSFLNEVLDRKTGIPITLSVLYMEIGNRVGLPVSGVGFPGHFIIRYSAELEILIDPFNKGRILSERDCQEMLNRIYGGGLKLKSDLLQYATRKQILARMLHNLKNIYVDSKDFLKALSVVDMLLIIDPSDMSELRDRGLIYYKLECFVQALADLETYSRHAPQAVDRDVIGNCIMIIKELVERIN